MFGKEAFKAENDRQNEGKGNTGKGKTPTSGGSMVTPSSNNSNNNDSSRDVTPIPMDFHDNDDDVNDLAERLGDLVIPDTGNFGDEIPDHLKVPQKKNPYYKKKHNFENPFIMMVVGQTMSGKTTWVGNLVKRVNPIGATGDAKTYDNIWYIRPHAAPDDEKVEALKLLYGVKVFNEDNIPNIPQNNDRGTYLVIFDDMLNVKEAEKTIETYFKMGRRTCSIVFISQVYFDKSTIFLRKNTFYLALLPEFLPNDIKELMKVCGGGLANDVLHNIFSIGSGKDEFGMNSALVVDMTAALANRFYKGFSIMPIPVPPPAVFAAPMQQMYPPLNPPMIPSMIPPYVPSNDFDDNISVLSINTNYGRRSVAPSTAPTAAVASTAVAPTAATANQSSPFG